VEASHAAGSVYIGRGRHQQQSRSDPLLRVLLLAHASPITIKSKRDVAEGPQHLPHEQRFAQTLFFTWIKIEGGSGAYGLN
jgi:hypothetical protein